MAEPLDNILHSGKGYRLDMCLTRRKGNPRVHYFDRWRSQRFEPLG
jgi:hypothetical protein